MKLKYSDASAAVVTPNRCDVNNGNLYKTENAPKKIFLKDISLDLNQVEGFAGERIKEILPNTFYGERCIREVVLPDQLESIGRHSMCGTGIDKVEIPGTVHTIGPGAFSHCKDLEHATIGSPAKHKSLSVIFAGDSEAAEPFNLTSNLKNIPDRCFSNDDKLQTIHIGKGVKNVESTAFVDCDELKIVTCDKNIASRVKEALEVAGLNSVQVCTSPKEYRTALDNLPAVEREQPAEAAKKNAEQTFDLTTKDLVDQGFAKIENDTFTMTKKIPYDCKVLITDDAHTPEEYRFKHFSYNAFEDQKNITSLYVMNGAEMLPLTLKGCDGLTTFHAPHLDSDYESRLLKNINVVGGTVDQIYDAQNPNPKSYDGLSA